MALSCDVDIELWTDLILYDMMILFSHIMIKTVGLILTLIGITN